MMIREANGETRRGADESKQAAQALRSAARWRLSGLLFERPHDDWRQQVRRMATEVNDPDLGELAIAACDETEGEYLKMFGPGGALPPRAAAYRPMEDPGRILADLRSRFQAFHFEPRGEDPPDHVATLCGFAGYLALKQSYAAAHGAKEEAALARAALRDFLADHLAPLAHALAERCDRLGIDHPVAAAARIIARRTSSLYDPRRVKVDPDASPPDCSGCG